MKSFKNGFLSGFLIWLIPFIVAFLIFPIKISSPALFESVMPVVITICVVLFSLLYFRRLEANTLNEGIILGVMWFVISLVLDLFMFMPESPMKMTFTDYMMDIGLTYLIFPTITIGFGYLIEESRGDGNE